MIDKVFVFIIVYLLLENVKISNTNIEVNSGIYLERLPNVSFYQTTRQLIFRVHKPQSILDKFKCREEFCIKNAYICNLMKGNIDYFSYIIPNLEDKIINDDPILLDDGELFDYQLATRNHVPRTFTSDQEISVLLQRVKARDHVVTYEIEYPNPLRKAISNLTCDDTSLLNLVQLEFMLQYETGRNFINMCQSKKLQLDIVPMDKLVYILKSIADDVIKNDYVIALSSYSSLYTMPLVECMISRNTAVVGLHIPLLRKQFQGMQMKKVLTPSYAWQNYTCTVDIPPLTVALVNNNALWTILVPKCDPIRDELCFVSDSYDAETLGISCIKQVLQGGSFNQFGTVCPLSCRETGNENQFLTPLTSHKVLVTHPKPSLKLQCPATSHPLQVHRSVGNLIVTVPCHCYFTDDGTTIYPRYLCVDKNIKFSYKQTIPAGWTKFGGLTLAPMDSATLQFDTLEDCMEEEWIIRHYSKTSMPIITYFVILNFLLILTLIITIIYLYFRIRNSFRKIHQNPVNTTSQRKPLHPRTRKLPPTPEKKFKETTNDYLVPVRRKPESHTTPWTVLEPHVHQPSTSIQHTPEPHPKLITSASQTLNESHYVKMDRIMT